MLRLETETGWWLVTHPDHARLAGAFAERWGNDRFLPPEPRANVLKGIARHDDGWLARDAEAANHAPGKAQRVFDGAGRQVFGVRGDRPRRLSRGARSRRAADRRRGRLRRGAHLHAHVQLAERSRRSFDDRPGRVAAARSISGAAEIVPAIAAPANCRRSAILARASQRSRDSRSLPAACRPPTISRCSPAWISASRPICCIRFRCAMVDTRSVQVRSRGVSPLCARSLPVCRTSLNVPFPARVMCRARLFRLPRNCSNSSMRHQSRICRYAFRPPDGCIR